MKNPGNLKQAIIELKNDQNNAVAHLFENAKLNSQGELSNCVFTIKDNYADTDVYAKASSLILNNFKPQYKATIVKLLEEQGATCVARTHLDEFGLGGSGEYSAFGLIRNPINPEYLVGGSSSGAAATFSQNISFAIGSDTGDSVRKPASNIGKVGFKPSYGAISRYGLFAFASSLDTVAYFTHNVADSIKLSSCLYKQDLEHDLTSVDLAFDYKNIIERKPKKVIYFKTDNFINNEVKQRYDQLINKLKNEGIDVVEVVPDPKIITAIDVVYKIISFSEASSNLANLVGTNFGTRIEKENWVDTYIATRSSGLGKMVQSRLILGSLFLEQENQIKYFVKAKKMRRYIVNYFKEIHRQCDLLIFPASNDCAPKFNEVTTKSIWDFILTGANLSGNPSMTIKLGNKSNSNMPFNLALETDLYQDQSLFSYALYIEKIIGGLNE